jgi:hypothetical protein
MTAQWKPLALRHREHDYGETLECRLLLGRIPFFSYHLQPPFSLPRINTDETRIKAGFTDAAGHLFSPVSKSSLTIRALVCHR